MIERGTTLVAGAVAGLVGFVLFGVAHALIIEPIWTRMLGGIPFALAGGLALAFIVRETSSVPPSYLTSAGAGALAWAITLPGTGLVAWLRVSGLRQQVPELEVPLVLAMAVASGGLAGALITRRIRSALVLAVAGAVLVTAMHGPVPVTNSIRAAMLFVSFLPMFAAGGACVTLVWKTLATRLPHRDIAPARSAR